MKTPINSHIATSNTSTKQSPNSFYTNDELQNLGFKSLGQNVLISRFARFYGIEHISIGSNVRIDDFVILSGAISLGSFIHISAHAVIMGGNGVDSSVCFGDFCSLSLGSKILATSDDLTFGVLVNSCISSKYRNVKQSHIVLPKHNHIAAMSLVLPNTTFGEGANLGPQSLVGDMKLKSFGYYFGTPARLFKIIDSDEILRREAEFLKAHHINTTQNNIMGGGITLSLDSTPYIAFTQNPSTIQNRNHFTPNQALESSHTTLKRSA